MPRFALAALLCAARAAAEIPAAFLGTWTPINNTTTHAIIGPSGLLQHFAMTKDESNGDFWMSAIQGQVFRIRGGLMQYCFAHVATSPFVVNTTSEDRVVFCYHTGRRMNTHKATPRGLATGCDAAQIVLEMHGNGNLEFTFYMSPPVKHAWVVLERTGNPPPVWSYLLANLGGACDPENPDPPSLAAASEEVSAEPPSSMCPAVAKMRRAPTAERRSGEGMACRQLNSGSWFLNPKERVDIRLQYAVPTGACWPCNISYSVSAAIEEQQYVAVGFKGMGYRALPGEVRPNYFGMGTDDVDDARTSRAIVLGYAQSAGACVREMRAEGYVGAPTDVLGNPHLSAESAERRNGRTVVRFTVEQHVGRSAGEVDTFFNAEQLSARVMWAIGEVRGSGCAARVQYHTARGVSPLAWFNQNPPCGPDGAEPRTPAERGAAVVVV